ncbi:hypothetical protein M5K25_022815 [Dendrobium thyrsiflorum]|uniref:Reverse transcriptase zinc-binding domain-containing protein n=1 Tax=Dendrobium thyrsiflorum TaxID=117978 RepID=A0ABD0U6V4_DENTH
MGTRCDAYGETRLLISTLERGKVDCVFTQHGTVPSSSRRSVAQFPTSRTVPDVAQFASSQRRAVPTSAARPAPAPLLGPLPHRLRSLTPAGVATRAVAPAPSWHRLSRRHHVRCIGSGRSASGFTSNNQEETEALKPVEDVAEPVKAEEAGSGEDQKEAVKSEDEAEGQKPLSNLLQEKDAEEAAAAAGEENVKDSTEEAESKPEVSESNAEDAPAEEKQHKLAMLWDPWIDGKPLSSICLDRNILSYFPHNAKVSEFLDGGVWIMPDLVGNALASSLVLEWYKLVWHKHHALKYSIYTWIALNNGLKTADELSKRNIVVSTDCPLRYSQSESRFFGCMLLSLSDFPGDLFSYVPGWSFLATRRILARLQPESIHGLFPWIIFAIISVVYLLVWKGYAVAFGLYYSLGSQCFFLWCHVVIHGFDRSVISFFCICWLLLILVDAVQLGYWLVFASESFFLISFLSCIGFVPALFVLVLGFETLWVSSSSSQWRRGLAGKSPLLCLFYSIFRIVFGCFLRRVAGMATQCFADPGFLVSSVKSRSFVEALSGSSSDVRFPDVKISSFRGLPSLWISELEIRTLAAPFQFALVGFFPSKRPSLDSIRRFFFILKLNGEASVTLLDPLNWSPLLDVGVESPVIPIWVSFLQLRPHLYSPRILHGLASIFGKPLKIDTATSVGSRPSVAHVLVEIDIMKIYPDKVCVLGNCRDLYPSVPTPAITAMLASHLEPPVAPVVGGGVSVGVSGEGVVEPVAPMVVVRVSEGVSREDPGVVDVLGIKDNSSFLPVASDLAILEPVASPVCDAIVSDFEPPVGSPCVNVMVNSVDLGVGTVSREDGDSPNQLVVVDRAVIRPNTHLISDPVALVSVEVGKMPAGEFVNICTSVEGLVEPLLVNYSEEHLFSLLAAAVVPVVPELAAPSSEILGHCVEVDLPNSVQSALPPVLLEAQADIVEIPISVVSNDELKSHMAWSIKNSVLVQSNWLEMDDPNSTPSTTNSEDFGSHVNDDMYFFMVGCVVDQAVLNGGGKK